MPEIGVELPLSDIYADVGLESDGTEEPAG
jgi:hypothetical protein